MSTSLGVNMSESMEESLQKFARSFLILNLKNMLETNGFHFYSDLKRPQFDLRTILSGKMLNAIAEYCQFSCFSIRKASSPNLMQDYIIDTMQNLLEETPHHWMLWFPESHRYVDTHDYDEEAGYKYISVNQLGQILGNGFHINVLFTSMKEQSERLSLPLPKMQAIPFSVDSKAIPWRVFELN